MDKQYMKAVCQMSVDQREHQSVNFPLPSTRHPRCLQLVRDRLHSPYSSTLGPSGSQPAHQRHDARHTRFTPLRTLVTAHLPFHHYLTGTRTRLPHSASYHQNLQQTPSSAHQHFAHTRSSPPSHPSSPAPHYRSSIKRSHLQRRHSSTRAHPHRQRRRSSYPPPPYYPRDSCTRERHLVPQPLEGRLRYTMSC
jgi:hypothetical protein